ncbi:hypothetical protein G6F59_014383 [Rhizopus arrhizus]|nr:hypothetical protein G6F59_014383 [Rhizopus arrhizus]
MQLVDHVIGKALEQRAVADAELAVPGDGGAYVGVVRGVHPRQAPAPAKARHRHAAGVAAVLRGPGHAGIQVGEHLLVRHLADQVGDELGDVGIDRGIALALVEVGGHRQVAGLGDPAADVLDVLVHAEDLLHDQHDGQVAAAFRRGVIGGDGAIGHG